MKRLTYFLFMGGFGLLPLWVATYIMFRDSRGAGSEYWNAAPWILFLALPICGVTSLIAIITLRVHEGTEGTAARKFALSALSFVGLVGLATYGAYLFWQAKGLR